jgi:hypothetical protein
VLRSGRYRSRFCIARPAEVECFDPVATAHGSVLRARRRHEWQHPVATAHGSVLRALLRLSTSIRSLSAHGSVTARTRGVGIIR